jgi:hypothetical protein
MFALFGKFWCTPAVRQKACITATALSAFCRLPACAVDSKVSQNFARIHIAHNSAFRNFDDHLFATPAVQIFAHTVHTVSRTSVGVIAKCQQ